MSGPPRLPLHIGDYLKDTPPISRVNWEHHGIYLLALMTAWSTPKMRLPNDPTWLSRRFGCTVEEYQEYVEPVLREYFKCDGNFFRQKRLEHEHKFIAEQSKKQSERAKSRWKKEKEQSHGTNGAMPEDNSGIAPTPTPTPTPTPIGSTEPIRKLTAEQKAELWAEYPHPDNRGSKQKALDQAERAVKRGVPFATILDGVKSYAAKMQAPLRDGEFRPEPCMAATWFNQARWETEIEEAAQPPPGLSDAARARIAELEAESNGTKPLPYDQRNQGPDHGPLADVVDEDGERDAEGEAADVGAAIRGLGGALRA